MSDDYEEKLAAWKERHGLRDTDLSNTDEMRMAAEEQASKKTSWCFECGGEMPVKDMKLITRSIDPYVQIGEEEGDYIKEENRIRCCPKCFEEFKRD